jgi:hypothetical protein
MGRGFAGDACDRLMKVVDVAARCTVASTLLNPLKKICGTGYDTRI